MINLLEETIEALGMHGKTLSDVDWIGTTLVEIPLSYFVELANTSYHNGYGSSEVRENLVVAGDGWWLEREEYDGSEWWEYKTMPKRPRPTAKIKTSKLIFY